MLSFFRPILLCVALFLISCQVIYAQLQVDITRCENNQRPLGIPLSDFHFGWELSAKGRSEIQTAYQIGISSSKTKAAANIFDVWDSKKTIGDNSIMVPYRGKKLMPGTEYFWKVRVWNKNDLASVWSKTSSFGTGLESKDWKNAKWIGYEDLPDSMRVVPGVHTPYASKLKDKALKRPVTPLLRKEFTTNKKVSSAFAFISGLGHYVLNVNGNKAGNAFLAPGWTYYDKTCLYNVLDITSMIREGNNSLGVILGNGFFNINRERYFKLVDAFGMPKVLCRIKISYQDGTSEDIVTDGSWRTAPSPTTYNSIFGGEDYDARLEKEGWDKPGFNDKDWKKAEIIKAPLGKLVAEMDYPVAIMDSFNVVKITEPKPKVFVYDFGQNASGVPEIKVKGRRGQIIKFIPAEILDNANLPNQDAIGKPYFFTYTLKGDGVETWRPNFTYYGFRYLQVEGATPSGQAETDLPQIVDIRFMHNRNSAPSNGTFNCSNELFNKIFTLINWAIKSNMQSVATDCPHREKLSWLEQDYLMGNSIHYNFDNYLLYKKLVDDMIDAQTPEGLIPDIAPEFVQFEGGFRDSPEWGSAAIIVPWQLYTWNRDEVTVRKAYPMMKKYVSYLRSKSDLYILSHGLGDWFDYGPKRPGESQLTPKALTATAIYYYDVILLGKMAEVLGEHKDAADYTSQAQEIKAAFNAKFFDEKKGVYSTGSQTAMAMPLSVGLVDLAHKESVLGNLVDSITSQNYKLTAGDIGFHFLVDALDKGGKSSLLYKMNNRDDVPGYGFQLKKGATALTESWPALQNVSNNHLMLGHVMEWFYSGLAGIDQESSSVGFKTLRIRPQPVGDITSASGSFHSPYGWVKTFWKKEGSTFTLSVTIPANSQANIYLPIIKNSKVYENGKLITAQVIDGNSVIKCGSGVYNFVIK
ncbi:MAG: family 78 glycoside hydrolase catalytic domain [Pelobium sp.]